MDSETELSKLRKLLMYAVKHGASDVHLAVGSAPAVRLAGEMRFTQHDPLQPADTVEFVREILTEKQYAAFIERGDADIAYSVPGLGRFRVNVLRQRGSIGLVMRHVKGVIQNFSSLNLPPVLGKIADFSRGLILITGTTGSGKSTTLASIIDWLNEHKRVHIITLEDPIEFLHTNKRSIITQREISIDTLDFGTALRAAMREDPDIILIGEMRDPETFQTAVSAAETGHLVFSTLHTTNVMLTIDRIMDMFPADLHAQVRAQLALQLRACISQRLLPTATGKGRVPAIEVMLNNPGIAQLIRDNTIRQIPSAMIAGATEGMQTFNMSLVSLINLGLINEADAMLASDNPDELKMNMQGIFNSGTRGGILRK